MNDPAIVDDIQETETWKREVGVVSEDAVSEDTELKGANGQKIPEVYFDHEKGHFWALNGRGSWSKFNEASVKRTLRVLGFSSKIPDCETVSPIDQILHDIQKHKDVNYAGPLAGMREGFHTVCGNRILVTQALKIIEPMEGECTTIDAFLEGLLGDPEHNQIQYLIGWIKFGLEALMSEGHRPGQALAIAGPADCGKSLLQDLLNEIFGGTGAKPYRYMSGGTDFNGELFGAMHLLIEDEVASTDIRHRRHFGARIKDFTVNSIQSCHAKNRQAISLTPLWRISISLNDEPENLMILPPIDESLEDKIILFKAYKNPMPMPTGTTKGREEFWNRLVSELPAFIHKCLNWEVPDNLKSERFGITHFHHPEIIAAMETLTPETRLMTLIDSTIFSGDLPLEWTGTSEELEKTLRGGAMGYEAGRLLNWNNATGTYLGRLRKKQPDRVTYGRNSSGRVWIINRK